MQPRRCSRATPQSSWMLAARITSAHLAVSLRMWSAISSGELCNNSAPASVTFCRTTGSATALVLDDDRLANELGHFLADQPREEVGSAACGIRYDQMDRLGWIVLRAGALDHSYRADCADRDKHRRSGSLLQGGPQHMLRSAEVTA
jgi:hypothetical protein